MTKVNQFTLAALGTVVVAFIFVVVGVSTNGWMVIAGVNFGWSLQLSAASGSPRGQASYALGIISALGAATALTAISIEVTVKLLDKANEKLSPNLLLVTLIAAEIGGTCGIIASILQVVGYVGTDSYMPGYSFFLTIIGSIILLVGGALARKAKLGGQAIGV